ncbi:MAG: ABC transporter permease, partial [Oscillospiraceae bacterium]|nr:ABC transporter permease [Oscillospiraceae bacterium]
MVRPPKIVKAHTFKKDIRRSIRSSFGRFFAIMVIVALGAGIYAGLNAVAPDMRLTINRYYEEGRLFDVRLLSTLGFTDEDLDEIKSVEGVKDFMAGYTVDALSLLGSKEQVVTVHSLPSDCSEDNENYLNRPVLLSGRMPQSAGECLISASKLEENEIALGAKIILENDDGELDDVLEIMEFEVVGTVNSSYYISMTYGTSSIGNGTVSRFIYVPEAAFCSEVYTDVHLTVEGAAGLDCFTDEYLDAVELVTDRLDTLADERERLRYDEVYSEAR